LKTCQSEENDGKTDESRDGQMAEMAEMAGDELTGRRRSCIF
jgi:hypothetical protein